jgi:hypothetical protein
VDLVDPLTDPLDRLRAFVETGAPAVPLAIVRAALDVIDGPRAARIRRNAALRRAASLLVPDGSRYGRACALEKAIWRFERRCGPPATDVDANIAEAFRAGAPMVRTWRRLIDLLPPS